MQDIFDGSHFTIEVCNTTLRLIASNYNKLIDSDDKYLHYRENDGYKYIIIDFIQLCYNKVLKDKYCNLPSFNKYSYAGRMKFDESYSDNYQLSETICNRPFMYIYVSLRDYIEMHIDNPNSHSGRVINNELNTIYKSLSEAKKLKVKNVIPHWIDFTDEDGSISLVETINTINKLQLTE